MKSVLLVDDDAGILDGLADLLSDSYRVVTARDGEEALARLASGAAPDVIVLDMLMPLLDGEGVVRELGRRGIEIPVIVASAHKDLGERARVLGVADWIAKPFEIDALEQKIARIVGGNDASGRGGGGTSPRSGGLTDEGASFDVGGRHDFGRPLDRRS